MRQSPSPEAGRPSGFGRPGWIVGLCAVGLAVSCAVAVQRPVPGWELDLTRWINGAPEWCSDVLYPVMQLGTLAGPLIVAALIALVGRDWSLGAATLVAGLAAWFVAKGIKRVVDRGRPLEYLPEISVREGDGAGLGYVSGHSAVAASAAVMAMVALPPRWRPAAAVLAALVGIARIVHGVHLPADVVGGWCVGVLVALGALWIVDRVESRGATARRSEPVAG
jgi:membrane-associated phospholipid phosphatase